MENNVKGKKTSVTGLIISIFSLPLAGLVFFVAYVNNFDRVWVLVAGGLALFSLIGFFVSSMGSSKMKSSGEKNTIGKIGMVLSALSLITSAGVIVKGATTKQVENAVYDDKAFD